MGCAPFFFGNVAPFVPVHYYCLYMDVQFFKKEVPSTPIFAGNGSKITFDTVDNIIGYTMSGDPTIISHLQSCISRGVGGVMVCSQEEYEEFVKKKGSNSSPRPSFQREEIKPQSYAPNTSGVNRVGVEQDRQGKEKTYSQSDIKAAVEEAIRELSSRNVDMKPQAAAPEGGEAKPAVEQFKPTRAKKKK